MRRMGAACCVAAKDSAIVHGPSGGTVQRQVGYSPSWSFRWDNRVAGEEANANWLHDRGARNDHVEVKSGTAVQTSFALDEGGLQDSLRQHYQKSVSDGNVGVSKLQYSDEAIPRNLVEVKEFAESPSVSHPSSAKLSPLAVSVSTSPLTSQSQLHQASLTPSRCHPYSRGPHFLHQVSASQISEFKSPAFSLSEEVSSHPPPDLGSESTTGSNFGSSDSWSIPVFSELMATRRDRWSFDSENSGFCVDKTDRSSWRSSDSASIDIQTCGVCAKLLSERSSWGWSCQKIVSTNELAVVSVLNCGHVYHSECLEFMTPEINKYDPDCPVCTFGEKQALKISEKALKAELDLKARKISRKRVVDGDPKSNITFERQERGGAEGKGSKISSSLGKLFLKRNIPVNSKSGKPVPENQIARRKGVSWARSSKY